MKRLLLALGLVLAGASACGVSFVAVRHQPTIRPNTYVGTLNLGGLGQDEAARRLRVWWETAKRSPLKLEAKGISASFPAKTPGALGVTLDDQATVAQLPTSDLITGVENSLGLAQPDRQNFPPRYKFSPADLFQLSAQIKKAAGSPHPAKCVWANGQVDRIPEVDPLTLDTASVPQKVVDALNAGQDTLELPVNVPPKKIPDESLGQITDLVSSYSTQFSTGKRTRCWNIRLASSKLHGLILMPGDRFSFNGAVGRRTLRAGFKLAGIYKNGQHDVGIGGGICQVSTTLYNACLLADLGIEQRSSHSLTVPYVPLGRDATVDYGALDLVVENTNTAPIAIDSYYQPGRLTFRILGKKDPTLSVHILSAGLRSWDPGTQTLIDHRLKPGARHVIKRGYWGHSVLTYRLVYKDGKLVRKDRLGRSTYGGQAWVVAINPKPKATPVTAPTVAPAIPSGLPQKPVTPQVSPHPGA